MRSCGFLLDSATTGYRSLNENRSCAQIVESLCGATVNVTQTIKDGQNLLKNQLSRVNYTLIIMLRR